MLWETRCPSSSALLNGLVLWLLFAAVYAVMHAIDERHFGFTDVWVDPVYFSATATSTVGFGDVMPRTRLARLVVTVHLLGTLGLFVALVCRLANNH